MGFSVISYGTEESFSLRAFGRPYVISYGPEWSVCDYVVISGTDGTDSSDDFCRQSVISYGTEGPSVVDRPRGVEFWIISAPPYAVAR